MRLFSFIAHSSVFLILAAAQMPSAPAQTPAPIAHANRAPDPAAANWRAMLDRYCVTCHNGRSKTGGLTLDRIDLARVPDQAEIWEKVVRKLHARAMPPVGLPRPDRTVSDGFVTWLEAKLDAAATGDPGPAGLRRLNRSEYAAAVRDLLALDVDTAALLPADDANHGFDNMSDALRVSPALLEGYMSAARKISRLAVGDPNVTPAFSTYRVRADLGQDRHIEGLPLGTRGGLAVEVNFPLTGEYVFQPKLAVDTSAKVRGLDFEHEVVITVDGKTVHQAVIGGSKDEEAAALSPHDSEVDIRSRLEVRVPVSAGLHTVGVAFIKKTSALSDGLLQPFQRTNFDTQEQRGVPFLESLSIGGPFNASGPGNTPSRRKIFVCRPQNSGDETACAKKILTELTKRAYRRPATDADIETPLSFYQTALKAAPPGERPDRSFDAGIESALTFILTSPEFLFRVEPVAPGDKPGAFRRLGDLELASRLSFFLWSSIPDDELLHVAAHGKLSDPLILEKQVRRMLADARSDALATNFAAQWLYLRNLRGMSRDFATFPNFDDNLRQGFERETELFFESIVREDRSVLDLLRADYSFVNERLAKHYGIPNVYGSEFRRVTLPGDERRGLLGQGSVLAVTSYATRTSPVLRGKWLLENILGTPVPPPPPGVPALEENHSGLRPRSVRERMEEHRKNPACSGCHNIMDPLGFSLENFDAVGAWRVRSESGAPIDASGKLVDGTSVDGPVGLRNALLARSGAFTQTLTEKLMTYAIGRGIEYYDMPAVRSIVRAAAPADYRFSSLILGIVRSAPFQMRRTEIAETPAARQQLARK
jgi:mono/diheme cytochrome c family protein